MRWFSGLLALECLLALAQGAPARAAGIDEGMVAARDMAGLYQRLCLEAFPSPAAVRGVLTAAGARALAGAEAADLLHGAPGRAWQLSTAVATYQVTLLDAPFNSCAVQRMSPDGLATALPYIDAVRDYARAKSLTLGAVAPLEESLGAGGDLTILATPMGGDARHEPTDSSMYVVTNYHGHYAGWNAPATIGGPGVQIRMTHQIVAMR